MPIHNLSAQPSLIDTYVSELRNTVTQQDRMRFRRNIERIGEIMAYEISKVLPYQTQSVQTPLGHASMPVLKIQPVLGTILRAGLPLHQGFLNYFDKADNAFLSAYRKNVAEGGFSIAMEYITCADFKGRPLIISDPMLATGQSLLQALKTLLSLAIPSSLHIACVIASEQGIALIHNAHPTAHIWVAAIDADLNKMAYIVPGLGDAGDLAFGEKMQN